MGCKHFDERNVSARPLLQRKHLLVSTKTLIIHSMTNSNYFIEEKDLGLLIAASSTCLGGDADVGGGGVNLSNGASPTSTSAFCVCVPTEMQRPLPSLSQAGKTAQKTPLPKK